MTKNGVEMSEAMARLAIDEAVRAIDRQETLVAGLRTRAFSFVGWVTTASAFFIGASLQSPVRNEGFYVFLLIGTGIYAVLLLLLWGTQSKLNGWRSRVASKIIIEDFAFLPPEEGFKQLAGMYDEAVEANRKKINSLSAEVHAVIVVSGLLIACWIGLIWSVAK